jgi:hypothetical protein
MAIRSERIEIKPEEKRMLYTKSILNASARARSKVLRFLTSTAFGKIRQVRLMTVLSENLLLKKMDSGAFKSTVQIIRAIFLFFSL